MPFTASKGRRIAAIGVAVVVIVSTTAAATAAVTSRGTPTSVKACVSGAGRLAVLSSSGRCPSKYSHVTLNVTGPKGATGARGAPGAKGKTGAQGIQGVQGIQGPGAHTLVAETASVTSATTQEYTDTASGLTVEAYCEADGASDLEVFDSGSHPTTAYDVRGTAAQVQGTPYIYLNNSGYQAINSNTSVSIVATNPVSPNDFGISAGTGQQATFDFVVLRKLTSARGFVSWSSFTVTGYIDDQSTYCLTQAQVTPSG